MVDADPGERSSDRIRKVGTLELETVQTRCVKCVQAELVSSLGESWKPA